MVQSGRIGDMIVVNETRKHAVADYCNSRLCPQTDPVEGSLAYAVLLSVRETPWISLRDVSNEIDEPVNLVSGTLKYLLNKRCLIRTKEFGIYRYRAMMQW